MSNNITKFLGIKEPNLKALINKEGKICLTFTPSNVKCPSCSSKKLVRNGFKHTNPIFSSINRRKEFINLKKQSFYCKHCGYNFSPNPKFIQYRKKHCKATTLNVIEDLKTNHSMKDIAKRNNVSSSTVLRILDQCVDSNYSVSKTLPEHISIDEFQATTKLAFIFSNSETHQIINIFESRRGFYLEKMFSLYSKEEKAKVKTVTMDIFLPYFTFVKKTFPNATIILDRFHIVQNITRAVNKSRIDVMKSFNTNSHNYRMFKRFWKIYLAPKNELSNKRVFSIRKLDKRLSAYQVSEYLDTLSDELEEVHSFLQNFYYAMYTKNIQVFENIIKEGISNNTVNKHLNVQLNTCLDYLEYIENALNYKYNNGHLEGTINKIKKLKSNAYGFRSFENFKRRIFLHCNVVL